MILFPLCRFISKRVLTVPLSVILIAIVENVLAMSNISITIERYVGKHTYASNATEAFRNRVHSRGTKNHTAKSHNLMNLRNVSCAKGNFQERTASHVI